MEWYLGTGTTLLYLTHSTAAATQLQLPGHPWTVTGQTSIPLHRITSDNRGTYQN